MLNLILSPEAPTTAYKAGAKGSSLEMYTSDIYTVPVSIAGLPALSMPCARDGEGLPVGVQLDSRARHFAEQKIYRAGLALEQAVGTYERNRGAGRRQVMADMYEAVIGLEIHMELNTKFQDILLLPDDVRRGAQYAVLPGVLRTAGHSAGA